MPIQNQNIQRPNFPVNMSNQNPYNQNFVEMQPGSFLQGGPNNNNMMGIGQNVPFSGSA